VLCPVLRALDPNVQGQAGMSIVGDLASKGCMEMQRIEVQLLIRER